VEYRDMSETTTFASLDQVLLARKGKAAPASGSRANTGDASPEAERAAPIPEVKRQQEELAARISNDTCTTITLPASAGRRAAFTLRLDPERHLKLKLAATLEGRSAQQLVTQALDEFLAANPEIESLAARVKRG
jgi:predicted HicB family RNase H-like nuclease